MLRPIWLTIILSFLLSGSTSLYAFRPVVPAPGVKDWRLAAITIRNKGPQVEKIAVLESRDGLSYIVREGDVAGPDKARIIEISDKWILIERRVKLPNGAYKPGPESIRLHLEDRPETDQSIEPLF